MTKDLQARCGLFVRSTIVPLLVLLAGLAGCGLESTLRPHERVALRLLDPPLRGNPYPAFLGRDSGAQYPSVPGSAASLPIATVRDDSRPVLARHVRHLLAYQERVETDSTGRFSLPLELDSSFVEKDLVIFAAHVKPEGGFWRRWPMTSAAATPRPDGRLGVEFTGQIEERVRSVTVTVHALKAIASFAVESAAVEIPDHARLEFAIANEGATADSPPLRFLVDLCQEGKCDPIFDETVEPTEQGGVLPWETRTVSLERYAGQTRYFRFSERSPPPGRLLPLIAEPRILVPEGRMGRHPNLVVISIDTLRADHLPTYGYRSATAPFLSSVLAPCGLVFENLVAEAATTDASHMTIFTGLPALVHGVHGFQRPLKVPAATLASHLREAGYRTGAFTEDGPLAQHRGFGIGFDRYIENKSRSLLLPSGQVDRTFAQGRRWLQEIGGERFFLFLHTFQVHAPYAPSKKYRDLFTSDALSPGSAREAAAYDAEIRMVDDELRSLVEWMDDRGLLENTIVVVLSDHGEEFREHGSVGHATLPYQTVLHSPLIVTGPGIDAGRRSTLVHHIDLLPTILDLLEIPTPADLPGRSFARLLRGGADAALEPRAQFSATWALPKGLKPPALAVRLGTRKLIRFTTHSGVIRDLYFDLATDPGEQRVQSVATDEGATLDTMLRNYLSASRELHGRLTRAATGEKPALPVGLDPEQEEKLRALGYIE